MEEVEEEKGVRIRKGGRWKRRREKERGMRKRNRRDGPGRGESDDGCGK